MAQDAELTRIQQSIQARKQEYQGRLDARFHLGKNATARARIAQCDTLLQIIVNAQTELQLNYRPADTTAQIDLVIQQCNQSSTFSSALARLAERLKRRLHMHRYRRQRNEVLAAQSFAWNAPSSVINLLLNPANGQHLQSKIDVQCAIQFLSPNGQYQPVDPLDQEYSDQIASITLTDGNGVASCHPTALGLQTILGQENGYFATAGGAGPALRADAIELAAEALRADTRARVIWLKCTATADGHSFTLVKKPSGRVDVLEAWANPGGNGYLRSLRQQLKHDIEREDALDAVTKLNSPNSRVRDEGYAALSTAYGRAEDQPSAHFEELRHNVRDRDANISILCTVRDLASYDTVRARMLARYQVLGNLRGQLGI